MSRSVRRSAPALPLILALVACGREPIGPEGGPVLSQATVLEVHALLFAEVEAVAIQAVLPPATPAASGPALQVQPEPIDRTTPCPLGGSLRVQGGVHGVVSGDEGTRFALDLIQTPQACVIPTTESGPLTVTGAPSLTISATLDFAPGFNAFSGTFDHVGAYDWSGSATSGSCTLNYTYDHAVPNLQPEPAQVSWRVTGTVCGHAIEREEPVLLDAH